MLETTLKNGLKVIVEENHTSKVVAAQVWVRVGSADEAPIEAGIAHVHEHMLFKGTERRKVGEIAADVEAAGGDINAWTSFDQTVYHVTIASRELPVALDILADAVQHSAFDGDELGRELEVVLEELRRGNDTPSRVASEMLFQTAYQKHTYARPVIGYVDVVKSFTRPMIVDFYRRWYQPRNMCLVVVGDVDGDDVVRRAEKLFEGDRNQGPRPEHHREKEPSQAGLRSVVKSQDIQETHLGVAWHGTRLADEDTPALDVLSILLGTGESSRLYRRLKRERELFNDCYAYSYTPQDPGLMVVGGQIHGANIEEAFRGLLEETLRLRYEAPEGAEIEKAKTIILSDAVYQKETVQGIARKLGYFELVAGNLAFEELYYAKVKEVTPEDVKRVAKKYLTPEGLSVATLLPTAHEGKMAHAAVERIVKEVGDKLEREHEKPRFTLGALQVAKTKLTNGATLLVLEDRSVPIVSIRVAAEGGLLSETKSNNGISQIAGELICRGTEKYPAEQIIEETDAMAGGISGQSGRNSLGLRGEFLRESWERGFELFSSCLLEPIFPPAELEKERKNQLEEIAARQDSLGAVVFERFSEALYGSHPYGMPTQGTTESVKSFTRDQVLASYRSQLAPDRLTIAVVGAVDVDRTIKLVESRIGTRQRHPDAPKIIRPAAPEVPTAPRDTRFAKDKEQAHLVLGFMGVTMKDPRRYALEVLASVLGGQSGRLFLELRDKQSLAYSVSAFSLEGLDPGYFAVYIGTSPDKVETAERGIRTELQKILDAEVTNAELSRAHRYLIGSHEISLQRMSARSGTMALNECYGFGYDAHAYYADRVAAVTSKQIREVARDIIRFDRAVRAVVASRP